MKNNKRIVVYEITFEDQTMLTKDKQAVLDEVKKLLLYVGTSIEIKSSVRPSRQYNSLADWNEWSGL